MFIDLNTAIEVYLPQKINKDKSVELIELLNKENNGFIGIGRTNDDIEAFYDLKTGLIWEAIKHPSKTYKIGDNSLDEIISKTAHLNITTWELPSKTKFVKFITNKNCPLRAGNKWRLLNECEWLTKKGCIDADDRYLLEDETETGHVLLTNSILKDPETFVNTAIKHYWYFYVIKDGTVPNWDLEQIDLNRQISLLVKSNITLELENLDYIRLRQPKLEPSWWQDHNKGLWELWGNSETKLKELGFRARNPELDIQDQPIAIDFGTSSTVVAYSKQGKNRLLRVGLKDFYSTPKAKDYENPTVLEFIDIEAMLSAWQKNVYRPEVLWDQVRCSHEAKSALDGSDGDSAKVSSVLTHLKQWVLKNDNAPKVRLIDQLKGFEHELVSAERTLNPVKGQRLQVTEDYPFDPLELYAWFLGMSINWRQRGIFLQYYMTFPVKYTQEIRNRILASFRRGLLRSIPETLSDEAFDNFSVEERHSEPAAYAIAALHTSEIEPTDQGVAYAVFDFGGGTTDFDYGLYRWATEDEEDEDGTEEVFEQFGTGGDPFLGGEHLLENLAYETFKHNLQTCREKHIVFTQPEDADGFSGSEMLVDSSRIARTNSYRIMSLLRPLWEAGELENSSGRIRLDLLSRENEETDCELSFDQEILKDFLSQRILRGVVNFFSGLNDAFENRLPKEFYLILGGNSCRSPFVAEIFEAAVKLNQTDDLLLGERELLEEHLEDMDVETSLSNVEQQIQTELQQIFTQQMPIWSLIQPLEADTDHPDSKPTAKTGVAWGLLTLKPGSPIKIINHAVDRANSDAPFTWFVGSIRRRKFQPEIKANEAWGDWVELGKPREGVFPLAYTQEAATEGKKPEQISLKYKDIQLSGITQGNRLYARIIGSNKIEVCTAKDQDSLREPDNSHEILLD